MMPAQLHDLRLANADGGCDCRTPIAALSEVTLVLEAAHDIPLLSDFFTPHPVVVGLPEKLSRQQAPPNEMHL